MAERKRDENEQADPREQQAAAEEAAAEEVRAETKGEEVEGTESSVADPDSTGAAPPEPAAEQPEASEAADQPADEAADQPAADAGDEEPTDADEQPPGVEVQPDAGTVRDNLPAGRPAAAEGVIPGADLEPDIVAEGEDPFGRPDPLMEEIEAAAHPEADDADAAPIAQAAIDLAADARYRATGKRKTAVARVILRPGNGEYHVNGRALEQMFPRPTLQRDIRQPLETVGYADRMDVVARLHGGGVSAQAGALRHGIARALIEADPNLRSELKRRGFLTRDARAKERKKAGLKKARKRPQFSKR